MGDEYYPVPQNKSRKRQASSVSERNGKIWHSLVEIYGSRWIKEFGAEPGKIWCQMFNSLTDDQIREAIAHCIKEFKIHPPRMGQFREAALLHTPARVPLRDPVEDMSDYACGANRVMYTIVMEKNGVSKNKLNRMLAEKKRLVHDFELMAEDEETKPEWEKFIHLIDQRLRYAMDHKKPA
jgi:hypothetical protein